jgi:hypothetical protein
MKKNLSIHIVTAIALLTPAITFAAGKNLAYIIDLIISYLNQFLVLLIGLAVVIFVWYIIQYFIKPNEDRKNAGQYVMYSLIGFFVVLSFWGLVNILQNTFGLQNESNQPASWTSFKNIFPGGSAGGSGSGPTTPSFNGAGSGPTTPTFNGAGSGPTTPGNGSGSNVSPTGSFDPYGHEYNPTSATQLDGELNNPRGQEP